jgi:GNAT superfamily N-acetyltransferase
MNWYDKLNRYFPEQEMKTKEHLNDLIEDKDVYHKEETEDYIVLYAEFPEFIFIDYLLVTSTRRGKGIGTGILNRFKAKGKMILLEAEQPDIDDVDTEKRMAFYMRNGFLNANRILYEREDQEGESYSMNILYWPGPVKENSQQIIMGRMTEACRVIHNYRSRHYYGREVANPEKVLRWIE